MMELTGQRFGAWTVLRRAVSEVPNRSYWKCQCDCDREYIVLQSGLLSGRSTQCRSCAGKRAAQRREKDKES